MYMATITNIGEETTESYEINLGGNFLENTEIPIVFDFIPIPAEHELIIFTTILVVGLALNSIILYCFFRHKSELAVYIRVFAIVDCIILVVGVIRLSR